MELGIHTEIGELLDVYKKYLMSGSKDFNDEQALKEFGDICFYVVNEASFNNFDFDENFKPKMIFSKEANPIMAIMDFQKIRLLGGFLRYEDVINHLFSIATVMEIDFDKALIINVEKLKKRYPDGFSYEKLLEKEARKLSKVEEKV